MNTTRTRKSTAGLMDRVVPTSKRIFDSSVRDRRVACSTNTFGGWVSERSAAVGGWGSPMRWNGTCFSATPGGSDRLPIVGRTIYSVLIPDSASSSQSTSEVTTPVLDHPEYHFSQQPHGFNQTFNVDGYWQQPTEAGLCTMATDSWPLTNTSGTYLERTCEGPLTEQVMFDRYLNIEECSEDWES